MAGAGELHSLQPHVPILGEKEEKGEVGRDDAVRRTWVFPEMVAYISLARTVSHGNSYLQSSLGKCFKWEHCWSWKKIEILWRMKKGHGYERALSSIHLRCVYLKRLGEGKGHYRTRQSLPMYIGIYLKINKQQNQGRIIHLWYLQIKF